MTNIIVNLSDDGTINAEVNGIQGPGCMCHVDALGEAIGADSGDAKLKDDYHKRPDVAQNFGNEVQ